MVHLWSTNNVDERALYNDAGTKLNDNAMNQANRISQMHLWKMRLFISMANFNGTIRTLLWFDSYIDDTFCWLCINSDRSATVRRCRYWLAIMRATNMHKMHTLPVQTSTDSLIAKSTKMESKECLKLGLKWPMTRCNSQHLEELNIHLKESDFHLLNHIAIS